MFFFVVFFTIGSIALAVAVLYNDLLGYYRNKQLLEIAGGVIERLEVLNNDYDALLEHIRKDPNFSKRLAPVILGTERQGQKETIYPAVTAEQLNAVRIALTEDTNQPGPGKNLPRWLMRCGQPYRRVMLFTAGCCLILISFIWFGSGKEQRQDSVEPQ
ncbi:MAG: hypothetical protein ACYSRR_00200 [Planctomycetota bacterium]|jgi:hypothetical protein